MTRINLGRLLQYTFLVWITVITVRYATAVFQGLRTPISPGTDIEWLMLWTVAAVVVAILAAGFRNAPIFLPLLLAFACFVVLSLSGNFFAGLVTLWIFAVAHCWGLRLLRFTGVDVDGLLESISLTIPLGLIVPALAGFLLAAAHVLNPISVWLLLIAFTVPAIRWAERSSPPQLRRGGATASGLTRRGGGGQPVGFFDQHHPSLGYTSALPSTAEEGSFSFPILIMVPVAFLNFLWAVAPEIQYDANNYHLAVPRIYLADSGFVNLPNFFHSYFFRLVEMLFTLGLASGGPSAAKFMSFGFGLIATCCVFVLGKLTVDSRTGAWAAALFYTTPIVNWLSGTADNDLAVAMFITAALIAFLKFHGNDEAVGWLYITALLAGAAIATKVDAAFGLPPLFAVGFWKYRKAKTIVVCALLLLTVSLPWYALTFYWTGNPVFPLLNGVFKSPMWAIENRVMNANDYGIGTGFASLARLPFRLIFDTSRFGEAAPRGTAGISLLVALPFCGLLWRYQRNATALLIATGLSYMLLWAYSFQYLRYYAQILPVICVLAAATAFHFRAAAWLALALFLQFAAAPPQFWNIPERFPIAVALGRETREHFLERTIGPYHAVQYLNKVAKPGDRILGVEADQARFYLSAPMESLVESTVNSPLNKAKSMPSTGELADALRQAGFSYILASRSAVAAPASWYPYLQPDFIRQFATMEYRDADTALYRLKR